MTCLFYSKRHTGAFRSVTELERQEEHRAQSHRPTMWLTLVKGVLSVMVSKGDRAPLPSVGVATSQLNCTSVWLIPASLQRSLMTAYFGKWGSQGVTQTSG